MKRCIVADLHSEGPEVLVAKMQGQVDGWAFLGDYDDPRILRYILKAVKNRLIVIGNHDYMFARGDCPISRFTEGREDKLKKLWKEYEDEREFVLDCVDDLEGGVVGVRVMRQENSVNVAYVHAALGSTFTQSINDRFYCDDEQESARADNFTKMVENNVGLMFRGHDHLAAILSSNLGGKDIRKEEFISLIPFMFKTDRRYVVNVGAFVDENCYAIHDSDANSVVLGSCKVLV